jgi:hydroxyacid-oxoacid transhydrogenase
LFFSSNLLYTISGADIEKLRAGDDAGRVVADTLITLFDHWREFVPDGLSGMGYSNDDIPTLVKGTLPQRKVLDIAPRQPSPEDLAMLLEGSMKLF